MPTIGRKEAVMEQGVMCIGDLRRGSLGRIRDTEPEMSAEHAGVEDMKQIIACQRRRILELERELAFIRSQQ
jgi:hypothetical protein